MDRAARENHAPPTGFQGYRARVETELSLILRDTIGRESVAQIEQLATNAHWLRGRSYDMRVVGYRSQGLGVPYSTLSFVRGWTEPSLYGERLRLGALVGPPPDPSKPPRDTILAVHPFATDRYRYYRFFGGDTIAVLRSAQRAITIVRLVVSPILPDSTRFAGFDGEIHLDAERAQIVRMRGRFVSLSPESRGRSPVARISGVVAVAYSEFVNAEVNGKYWLPASQRTEFQTSFALLGRTRAAMRIVSRFSGYEVQDSASGDLLDDRRRIAHVTTWAPRDSISAFNAWNAPIGVATSSVAADDFEDLGPDAWRRTGPPLVSFMPARFSNLVGFDRVGGLYTGGEGSLRMRDAFPGLTAGARVGWAWSERTLRGGAHAALARGQYSYGVRAERALASTNDFLRPYQPESGGFAALLGSIDDFDYVDRRSALLSLSRFSRSFLTMQIGAGNDRPEIARLTRGLARSRSFLPNRGADAGSYVLGTAELEVNPGLSGESVTPGIGGTVRGEIGTGDLDWQRTEVVLTARRYVGHITIALDGNAGVVSGASIPPQRLFELGGSGSLPGYNYKEFVGDRAALFRGFAAYTFNVWRAPRRVWRSIVLPGLAPGVAASAQGGWAELSSSGARASASRLGVVTSPTDGVRASVGAGLTLFGGNAHIGFARPVDHAAPWRFTIGFGPAF